MEDSWYHIKARNTNINQPKGMVIKFWLSGTSEDDVREKLKKKTEVKDIEWVRKETPPFV